MAERPARRRKSAKSVEQLKAEISARDTARKEARAKRGPTGAAANPELQFKKKKLTPGEQREADKKRWREQGYVTGGRYSYGNQMTGSRSRGTQYQVNPRISYREFVEIANELKDQLNG